MAMSDHLLRFRALSTGALQTKQAELEKLDAAPFQQQSMGTKSWTMDRRTITDQLNAIAFILRERGAIILEPPPVNVGVGITDFSQIK